ncbi:MAG: NmrA family NAD(P)-binding protein [Sneathiella sp.]
MTQLEKILVLGASGKTGSATAFNLLAVGIPVRAFVHRLDARSTALEQAGAEIFLGSVSDFNSISAALIGIKKAYFVAPWTPEQLHFAMTFAVAAAQSNLELIVCVTQWLGQPQHPSVATRQSYLTDQVFDMIPNVDVIKINAGWFADNYMQPELLAMISQLGLFAFPLGDGLAAPISNEDLGRVISAALLNPAPYVGATLRPTGPKILSPTELAQTFSKVLGRSVKYDDISEKLFLKALGAMGMQTHMQAQLKHYVRDYKQGAFAGVTTVVKDMTGQEPESFEATVRRYVARNQITERTLSNKVKALRGFLTLLLTKPADLVHFEHIGGYPKVTGPKLGLDHAPWVDSHPI